MGIGLENLIGAGVGGYLQQNQQNLAMSPLPKSVQDPAYEIQFREMMTRAYQKAAAAEEARKAKAKAKAKEKAEPMPEAESPYSMKPRRIEL